MPWRKSRRIAVAGAGTPRPRTGTSRLLVVTAARHRTSRLASRFPARFQPRSSLGNFSVSICLIAARDRPANQPAIRPVSAPPARKRHHLARRLLKRLGPVDRPLRFGLRIAVPHHAAARRQPDRQATERRSCQKKYSDGEITIEDRAKARSVSTKPALAATSGTWRIRRLSADGHGQSDQFRPFRRAQQVRVGPKIQIAIRLPVRLPGDPEGGPDPGPVR